MLCVFVISPSSLGEGEDWVSEWSSDRQTDRLNEAAPGASEGLSHVLICFIFYILKLPAMPSNSPAAAEPPETPENDITNDVVRERDCC